MRKMASKGTSQAGTSGKPPPALRMTRASSRQVTATPPSGGTARPGEKGKKGKKGEKRLDKQVAPSAMYKIFDRIFHKYVEGMNFDAKVALQVFATLLQESENQAQL